LAELSKARQAKKRGDNLKNKERTLRAYWSKKENDLVYWSPRKADGHLLHGVLYYKSTLPTLEIPLLEELEKRGYDLTTIRFSIQLKADGESKK